MRVLLILLSVLLAGSVVVAEGSPAAPSAPPDLKNSIEIVEPQQGVKVRPYEMVDVVVSAEPHPGLLHVQATLGQGDPVRATSPGADGLWHLPVKVPANAIGKGEVSISAALRIDDKVVEYAVGTVELEIDLEGIELRLFAMKPLKIHCNPENESEAQLIVKARFSDGEARDMTAGKLGTRYRSSNSEVAEVSADGKITCLQPGRAVVFADFREHSASATIVVDEP